VASFVLDPQLLGITMQNLGNQELCTLGSSHYLLDILQTEEIK